MGRLLALDALRGVAVLAMVCWHTADSWLAPSLQRGESWMALRSVGGMAAPLFLLAAGASAALASGPHPAGGAGGRRHVGRGLEVLVLGYLLRLQTWLIDAGALYKYWTFRAWIPLLAGYLLLWWSCRRWGRPEPPQRVGRATAGGLALVAVGLLQVDFVSPGRLGRLLQVDVLQAIGASIALVSAALAWLPRLRDPLALAGLGVSVALCTPLVWNLLPGPLPVSIAAFLGKFPAAEGAPPPSRFPLFPWLAYALIGAGWVRWLQRVPPGRPHDARVALSAAVGVVLAVATSESLPHVYTTLAAQPWLAQPTRVAFRIGVAFALLQVAAVGSQMGHELTGWLRSMGRASLRIYWIHLPLVYGVLGNPLKGRLDHAQWGAAFTLLMATMWLLSRVRIPPARTIAPTHRA